MGQIMAATLPAGGNRTGQDRTGRDRSLNDFQEIFPLGPLGYGDIAGVWQVPLKGSAPVRRVRYRKKQACLAACIGAQKVTISSISANFHLQHLASSPSPAALFSLPQPSPHAPSFRFLCLSHSLLPSLPSPSSSPLRSFLLRIRYHTTPLVPSVPSRCTVSRLPHLNIAPHHHPTDTDTTHPIAAFILCRVCCRQPCLPAWTAPARLLPRHAPDPLRTDFTNNPPQ
jgi:hypothetical protein